MRVALATANSDKAREIAEILEGLGGIELVARPKELGDIDETGDTLEDNAVLKATAVAAATGLPAVADDTGLFVDALSGAPGVYSARYAGEHATYADNVAKLLDELVGVAAPRTARFETAAVLVHPDGRRTVGMGMVLGTIVESPRGAGGFGYDPLFVADEAGGRTLAELGDADKHAISHRGRALRALAAKLSAPG